MAEEKVDGLEGLDDFGDDFGEQLDSFMENDGDEEVDSELDSFFEDLSTIDDLESDDETITPEEKKEGKSNEKSSINFWTTSGMMAPFYEILRIMTNWLVKRGVKRNDAQKYITSLFLALSEDAVVNSKKELKYLVKDSQTPKGLNEQGLREMKKKGVYKSVVNTLNSIHKRLNK